jgi:hypothetical protein
MTNWSGATGYTPVYSKCKRGPTGEPQAGDFQMNSMHQEDKTELLLYCLGAGDREFKASVLDRWPDETWNELISQSERFALSAYLYHRLRTLPLKNPIPPTVARRLRQITLSNAARNIRIFNDLNTVLKALGDANIPVILLKGSHLAQFVYGDVSLRRMIDVDVMVKEEDLQRTVTLLFRTGFKVMNENLTGYRDEIKKNRFRILGESKHFFDLIHPCWELKLDVHCSITRALDPLNVDVCGLWDRSIKASLEGNEVRLLSPEDLILYLCLHTSLHHLFKFGLRSFCDMFETLERHHGKIDWEKLWKRAEEWGVDRCAYITLLLTKDLLGAHVPDPVLKTMNPGDLDPLLAAWTRQKILSDQRNRRFYTKDFIKLWKSRSFKDKTVLLFHSAFPSRRIMALMYPVSPDSMKIYFYYPVRIKDVAVRWGRVAWRLLCKNKELTMKMEVEKGDVMLEQWLI